MHQLDPLEETAVNFQVYNTIVHFHRSRNAFGEALRHDARISTRQLLITDLLHPFPEYYSSVGGFDPEKRSSARSDIVHFTGLWHESALYRNPLYHMICNTIIIK